MGIKKCGIPFSSSIRRSPGKRDLNSNRRNSETVLSRRGIGPISLPFLNAVYEVPYPFPLALTVRQENEIKLLNRRNSETISPIAMKYRTFLVVVPQCRL